MEKGASVCSQRSVRKSVGRWIQQAAMPRPISRSILGIPSARFCSGSGVTASWMGMPVRRAGHCRRGRVYPATQSLSPTAKNVRLWRPSSLTTLQFLQFLMRGLSARAVLLRIMAGIPRTQPMLVFVLARIPRRSASEARGRLEFGDCTETVEQTTGGPQSD